MRKPAALLALFLLGSAAAVATTIAASSEGTWLGITPTSAGRDGASQHVAEVANGLESGIDDLQRALAGTDERATQRARSRLLDSVAAVDALDARADSAPVLDTAPTALGTRPSSLAYVRAAAAYARAGAEQEDDASLERARGLLRLAGKGHAYARHAGQSTQRSS